MIAVLHPKMLGPAPGFVTRWRAHAAAIQQQLNQQDVVGRLQVNRRNISGVVVNRIKSGLDTDASKTTVLITTGKRLASFAGDCSQLNQDHFASVIR